MTTSEKVCNLLFHLIALGFAEEFLGRLEGKGGWGGTFESLFERCFNEAWSQLSQEQQNRNDYDSCRQTVRKKMLDIAFEAYRTKGG